MLEKKSVIERTVLWYVVFASLWVFSLDLLTRRAPVSPSMLSFIQLYKGIGFVAFSGILIYVLLLSGNRLELGRKGRDGKPAASGETRSPVDLADYEALIVRWSQAAELRNHDAKNHCQRVSDMTIQLARSFGLPEEQIAPIRWGAILHDIGKLGLPDSILLKDGPLTDEERRAMQQHPVIASQLLAGLPLLERAVEIPYCHHERWDGRGYPRGLKGNEIPLPARIFAVVEVWEALTNDRPYRKALPWRAAITYIRSQSGAQFDPQVVENFLQLSQIGRLRDDEIDL